MSKTDKRQEIRLKHNETLFIDITATAAGELLPAGFHIIRSLDISTKGLQLVVNQPLEVDELLDITLQRKSQPTTFSLTAEVKWIIDVPNVQEWAVGLSIIESDDPKLVEWKDLVENYLFSG